MLIKSGAVDAVLIATPHFQHTTLGIAALEAGVHAMVEKPISSHKADAERLIAVAQQHPRTVFGGMFQMRTEPRYHKVRKLITGGDLGQIVRLNWINTDWYRTEAYFVSGGWRATWKGEGGGVLLNQCLHNLDTLQWLAGMPRRVRGFCQLAGSWSVEIRHYRWATVRCDCEFQRQTAQTGSRSSARWASWSWKTTSCGSPKTRWT